MPPAVHLEGSQHTENRKRHNFEILRPWGSVPRDGGQVASTPHGAPHRTPITIAALSTSARPVSPISPSTSPSASSIRQHRSSRSLVFDVPIIRPSPHTHRSQQRWLYSGGGMGGCGGSMGRHGARDSGIRGAAVMSHGVWIQVIRERLTPSPRASGSPEQWLSTSQGSWTASGLAVHEPGLVDSHAPLCLRRVEDPANALRSPHRQSLIASSYPNRIAIPPSLHSPRIQFPRHWFPSVTVPSLASPSRSHLALQRFHMYMADASRLCAETRRPSIQRCSAITAS